jgi:predicted RecA/RadA family phage recombinase
MKTLYAPGSRIPYINTGAAISSGDVVVLRSGSAGMIGIAVTDIAATTGKGELQHGYPEKAHTLAKKVGDVFAIGTIVYWDPTNKWLTTTFTAAFTRAGCAFAAAASAATTGIVLINS